MALRAPFTLAAAGYIVTDSEQPEWRVASATRFVIIDAYSVTVNSIESNHTNDGRV